MKAERGKPFDTPGQISGHGEDPGSKQFQILVCRALRVLLANKTKYVRLRLDLSNHITSLALPDRPEAPATPLHEKDTL
jgi:hypothetical protein